MPEKELRDYEAKLFQRFIPSYFDGISSMAPTHELYEIIPSFPFSSGEQAVKDYIDAFERYVAEVVVDRGDISKLTLYWRKRPELREQDGKYKVYSRCLLSNSPIDAEYVQGIKNA